MREILFRGKGDKKYNDGAWYYGVPICDKDGDWQICTNNSKRTVIPETIGQYTGLADKNGTKIFEGDIVKEVLAGRTELYQITYNTYNSGFVGLICQQGIEFSAVDYELEEFEIIGNIYDNPELLGGK